MRCGEPLAEDRAFQCDPCDVLVEQTRAVREAYEEGHTIAGFLNRSGLPKPYREGLRGLHNVRSQVAVKSAQEVLVKKRGGIFAVGPAGAFKTTLACSMVAIWITTRKVSGLFVNALDLITDVQACYAHGSDLTRASIVKPLVEADALAIDDFDKIKSSEDAASIVYQVLDGRARVVGDNRLTVLTSNMPIVQICAKFPANYGEPIERRVVEQTKEIEMAL